MRHSGLVAALLCVSQGWVLAKDAPTLPPVPHDALVFVRTASTAGSGFAVRMGKKLYVVTNTHVLQGGANLTITQLNGVAVQWSGLELARDRDLARLTILPGADIIPLKWRSEQVRVGDTVRAFGDSQGAGAFTSIPGSVLGVGPKKVEVSSGFVSGNSGGAIVDTRGEVFAVATYVTWTRPSKDWIVKGTRFEKVRRFGLVLSDSIPWIAAEHRQVVAQAALLDDIETALSDAVDILLYYRDFLPNKFEYSRVRYGARPMSARLRVSVVAVRHYDDFNRHRSRYRAEGFKELVRNFHDLRLQYLEFNHWNAQTRSAGNLPSNQNVAYRKHYGKTFNRSIFKRHFSKCSKERDAALVGLCSQTKKTLRATKWLTDEFQAQAQAYVSILDMLSTEYERVLRSAVYRDERGLPEEIVKEDREFDLGAP